MYVKEYNPAAGGLVRKYTDSFAAGTTSAGFQPACGHFWLEGITASPNQGSTVYTIKAQTGVTFNPDGSISVASGTTVYLTASATSSDSVVVHTRDY